MKSTLRIAAVVLALAAGIFWLSRGADRGWSKTSLPVKTVDEVTGIEGITYRARFTPGIDFLAVALLLAAGLGLMSILIKPTEQNSRT